MFHDGSFSITAFIGLLSAAIMGLIWHDIRRIRQDVAKDVGDFKSAILSDMKVMSEKHSNCEKSLPVRFAAREEIGRLYGRIEEQSAIVNYLRGKINGHD
jgi:hypothetical protein